MKLVFVLCSAMFLASCSSVVLLKPEAEKVKISSQDPAKECKEMQMIEYILQPQAYGEGAFTSAQNGLRNKAAEMGANYVKINQQITNEKGDLVRLVGTTFKCP